jgi:hypoxanthine phosphoribosyltransferase
VSARDLDRWTIRAKDAPMQPEVYIGRERLATRVAELAAQIDADGGEGELVLLCVLKGSFIFFADLARALQRPARVEFLGVQSYGNATESSGVVQITQDLTQPVSGQDVLIVEDIVDTGLTAQYLIEQLRGRGARSVKLCALLHKPSRTRTPVPIDYLGFTIDDVFVVGYGLDLGQRFRTLPDVCTVSPDDGAR